VTLCEPLLGRDQLAWVRSPLVQN